MTATLDYARAGRRRWRRWVGRAAVMVVGVGVAVVGWRYGPAAWRQGRVLYWQHRCLTYALPADRVVYDEGPTAAGRVAAGEAVWYARHPAGLSATTARSDEWVPPPPTAVVSADCWRRFEALAPARSGLDGATLFCHELTSAAGVRRLVVVRHVPGDAREQFIGVDDGDTNTYELATLTRPPREVVKLRASSDFVPYTYTPQDLVIYAGQADPGDAAHFTIRYQMWGQTDTLDGRLTDGGFVRLTCRHRPEPP